MITQNEKTVLRELAHRYAELAALDINRERRQRCTNINDHIPDRPPVWIDEIPWHEMNFDGSLTLVCEDEFARQMEQFFRRCLFRWKYIQADMVLLPYYPLTKGFRMTDIGAQVHDNILATDSRNNIVSHAYQDQLDTEEKLEKLHLPQVFAYPEEDARRKAMAEEILRDILPVRLCGINFTFSPWDQLSYLRGVEPILYDLMDRPEFMHESMKKLTAIGAFSMSELERLKLLSPEPITLHCTPPFVSDFKDVNPETGCTLGQTWYRGMAQMLATVSPDMFDEFEVQYIQPLAERCGLTYYGCCEPLTYFIPKLRKIKNLRKLGVSPWADQEKCAQQILTDYTFARKPNPALVSGVADEQTIREETMNTLRIIREYNCAAEFVLKDISTVSGRPENLILWNKTVQRCIDEFYA